MGIFAVEFRPMNDDSFVKINRTRIRDGRLQVVIAGELYDSARLRPFYAVNHVFRNPVRDEVVAGGWGRYVIPTRGSREGMIVHMRHVRPNEEPVPVSTFHWLDDLPEDDPKVADAREMMTQAQEFEPGSRIEWPQMYAVANKMAYLTGIDEWGAKRLRRVDSIPLEKVEDPRRALGELQNVLGMSANLANEMERTLWSTLRHMGSKLMASMDYVAVPVRTDLWADMENVRLLQAVSKRHDLDNVPLKGRAGKITFCLCNV